MNICPLNDQVVIRRKEKQGVTTGGVILPDSAEKVSDRGIVIAHGPGKVLDNGFHKALQVQVGDLVVFQRYAARDDVDLGDGAQCYIIREEEILAILKEETDGNEEKTSGNGR